MHACQVDWGRGLVMWDPDLLESPGLPQDCTRHLKRWTFSFPFCPWAQE